MDSEDQHRQKDDKLQRILDAATTVFSQNGYRGATMQEVATEAGVGKGTIYLYFSSKEEMLETVLLDVLERYRDNMAEIVSEGGEPRETLHRLLCYVLEGADRRRGQFSFIFGGLTGMGEDFKRRIFDIKNEMLQILADFMSDSIDSGELRSADPHMMAHVVSGTLNSLAAARLWDDDDLVGGASGCGWSRDLADTAVDCLWKGMQG